MLGIATVAAAEEAKDKKGEPVKLEPFTHDFYWESFVISKDSPMSPDGRYRFKKVARDGSVKLISAPSSKESEVIIVKPMPKRFEQGERPPTIVVGESDFEKQTATIKELRMK